MSKRHGDVSFVVQTKKKQKTDDIWGDDEDELNIDECILQATQRVNI